MAVLLAQAALPNLVQTLENNPAFVHGGPFGNIAHGCNSVVATKAALALADIVVTEAGFGADLGAEKFFDIKCRKAGLRPDAAVVVATVRALKYNGGVARADLDREDVAAVRLGCANLGRHIANVRGYGVPVVVAINHFATDTEAETAAVRDYVAHHGTEAIVCRHWAEGGAGATDLAHRVAASSTAAARSSTRSTPTRCRSSTRWRPSPAASTAPTASSPPRASAPGSRPGSRPATGRCRYAWPRPSTRSRPTPTAAARPIGLRRPDPRGPPRRRRRLRRRHLRRDHDDAGPPPRPRRRDDVPRPRRAHRGAVVGTLP